MDQTSAIRALITKVRDNRQPCPPLKAVRENEPFPDWYQSQTPIHLSNVVLGAAAVELDPYPLLTKLMLRYGVAIEPRFIRVDTRESYDVWQAQHSPELAQLRNQLNQLAYRLQQHVLDPRAHDLSMENLDNTDVLGHGQSDVLGLMEKVEAKQIDMWLPENMKNKMWAWQEGDQVCTSILLSGPKGKLCICTSLDPIQKYYEEMTRAAIEANIPGSAIVDVLPSMSAVLGAGTVGKELLGGAVSTLAHPALTEPGAEAGLMLRLEPRECPAMSALFALAKECQAGDTQACAEWQRIVRDVKMAARPVGQALEEVMKLMSYPKMKLLTA